MGLIAADYLLALQGLLPAGPVWPREADAPITRMLDGQSEELARIDGRMESLVDEADPRITFELLADWERVVGLPDDCNLLVGVDLTIEQRQAALTAKMTIQGGQTIAYFIAVALALGFVITVTELGTSAWRINGSASTPVTYFTALSNASDALSTWGTNAVLECAINRLKPAHTVLTFAYA